MLLEGLGVLGTAAPSLRRRGVHLERALVAAVGSRACDVWLKTRELERKMLARF